jgi:sugar (pentulose or hexulose) kinase
MTTHTGCVLGIDAGTTSLRCIAWDAQGQALAQGRGAIPLHAVGPDGFEQDPNDWWRALCAATRAVMDQLPSPPLALCIAQQRETFVACDPDGAPRHPAILWMDERALPQVEAVRQHPLAPRLHALTGKPICVTPSLYKLLWLRDTHPAAFAGDLRVADVSAWLHHALTGRWVTSTACADPMGLSDIRTGRWDPDLLALVGLSESHLPALSPPGARLGELSAWAAAQTGLPQGLPVVAGAGDGQAAALGAGLRGPHEAYLNLGTALVSGVASPRLVCDAAFRTLAGADPRTWLLETDLKGGTFTLNWLVQRWLAPGADDDQKQATLDALERDAAALPPGAQGLALLPYWCGVMNPYWDDDAAGLVLGWRDRHGPAHLYRAALEGLALEQRLHTDGVQAALGAPIQRLVLMGGGSRSDLWCQIIADATHREVQRAASPETTSLGAAILAAPLAGLHPDLDAATAAMTRRGETFSPGEHQPHYDALFEEVYRPLYPALRAPMAALARLTRAQPHPQETP